MNYFIQESSKKLFSDGVMVTSLKKSIRSNIISICRSHDRDSLFYIFTTRSLIAVEVTPEGLVHSEAITPDNTKPLPFMPRRCSSSIHINNDLYLIGGMKDNKSTNICEKINLESSKWSRCMSLNFARSLCGIASTGNSIYVIGGWGLTLLRNIEKLVNSEWIILSFQCPEPLASIGVAKVSENQILIAGGRNNSDKKYSNKIWKLKIDTGEFSEEAIMEKDEPLSNHSAFYKSGVVSILDSDDNFSKYRINCDPWHDKRGFLELRKLLSITLV